MVDNDVMPIGEEPPNPRGVRATTPTSASGSNTFSSGMKCIGCGEAFKLLDLLPSSAGDKWRKCPKCSMNFQVG